MPAPTNSQGPVKPAPASHGRLHEITRCAGTTAGRRARECTRHGAGSNRNRLHCPGYATTEGETTFNGRHYGAGSNPGTRAFGNDGRRRAERGDTQQRVAQVRLQRNGYRLTALRAACAATPSRESSHSEEERADRGGNGAGEGGKASRKAILRGNGISEAISRRKRKKSAGFGRET